VTGVIGGHRADLSNPPIAGGPSRIGPRTRGSSQDHRPRPPALKAHGGAGPVARCGYGTAAHCDLRNGDFTTRLR